MSFIASLTSRVAAVSAKITILQSRVLQGSIAAKASKIQAKFDRFNLPSEQIQQNFFDAEESSFRKVELENLGADDEQILDAGFDESKTWERFRKSYDV